MNISRLTFFAGVVFVVLGICGFIPTFIAPPSVADPALLMDGSYGRLFGIFPMNTIHNLFHIAMGIIALIAARTVADSLLYCRWASIVFGVLTIMGLIPGLNTVFGLAPVFAGDVWLDLIFTVALSIIGYSHGTRRAHARYA